MGKTFVTSDTFFGRKNALKSRGFSDVETMNDVMINKWNEKVNKSDTVYHLGNFAWDPFSANLTLQELNGRIKFLLGNKDKALNEAAGMYEKVTVLPLQIVELKKFNMVLCHYPMEHWNGKEDGSIHLHGHTYSEFPTDLTKSLKFNICSDYWGLAPIELNVLLDMVYEFNKTI